MSGGIWRRFLARPPKPKTQPERLAAGVSFGPPVPPVYAVGDVHGRLDLFRKMESQIAADRAGEKLIVLLGDVVDRGPDSAGMIDHLLASPPPGISRVCLLGNHEDMALRFLQDPDPQADWLAHGGAEMLASYGVARDLDAIRSLSRKSLEMRIVAHVPEDHLRFLANLPTFMRAGANFYCHAGVDPALALGAQMRRTLLWSRRFLDDAGAPPPDLPEGGLVVQGHVPVAAPQQKAWRVNVDTGAFSTGRLSAVRLSAGEAPQFLSACG